MPKPMIKKPDTENRPDRLESKPETKPGLHPRNKHVGRYDFDRLIACDPDLATYVAPNTYGDRSVDFADPAAVRALNRALLRLHYGIAEWNPPAPYLCPPIPGRADYLHHLADLLALGNGGNIPYGKTIRVFDVGVGANLVYPLIGHSEYGWSFVGSDIDRAALAIAQSTLDANAAHREAIELRLQRSPIAIFKGIVGADELFDLTMSNPPFHASMDEAEAGSQRKWKNLGKSAASNTAPVLNFGGQSAELCCAGGEEGFIGRMIAESTLMRTQCLWFTTLVSKASSLPAVHKQLKQAGVHNSRTIEMAQGQKKSRIVAWTWFSETQRQAWRNRRRGETRNPRQT